MRRLVVVAAGLVAAWLVLCLVLFVWPPAETGAPAHADAVVMLSGDPERLPTAERLIREHVAPVLVISSVTETPDWRTAKALCRAGSYEGATVLCPEARPYSTQGEAETFSRLAEQRGWTSLVVVSSVYHLTRASVLFHRCYAGKLSFVGAPYAWSLTPLVWAGETLKLAFQLTFERGC